MSEDHEGRGLPGHGAARWPTLQVGAPDRAVPEVAGDSPQDAPPQPPRPSGGAPRRVRPGMSDRLRPTGRRVRGLLGAGVVAAVLVGAVALAADEFGRTTTSGGLPNLPEVHLRASGVASLTISAEQGSDVSWSTTSGLGAGCEASRTVEQGIGTLVLTCDPSPWGGSDADVSVPAGTRLVVDSPDADVRVAGQLAAVAVSSRDGDVDLTGVDGNVTVTTTDGDVGGTVRAADAVAVTTGDGDVDLRFDGVIGATRVRTGDGNVALTVPTGGPYRLDIPADSSSELDSDPSSPRAITVTTGDGEIELRK